MLRVFRCEPYRCEVTTSSCGARYRSANAQHGRGAGAKGALLGRHAIHCVDCDVGRLHSRGQDAPEVEYSARDLPPPRPDAAPAPAPLQRELALGVAGAGS